MPNKMEHNLKNVKEMSSKRQSTKISSNEAICYNKTVCNLILTFFYFPPKNQLKTQNILRKAPKSLNSKKKKM